MMKSTTISLFDNCDKVNKIVKFPAKVYLCGPTVYDDCHLGHARCYVAFDFLIRALKTIGKVIFCRNITDVNEKIRAKATAVGLTEQQLASKYINSFHEDLINLNCIKPDIEPTVSAHIPEIIDYIIKLREIGCTYKTSNGIYFSVNTIDNYGLFKDQEELQSRIKKDLEKKSPKDFCLWKFDKQGFNSTFGMGYPGWHIECSAMSLKYFGKEFTIHGGGQDLQFPHHENEIAQSKGCFGCNPASIWMHNGMIRTGKNKMSKSLGNCFYIKDLIKTKFHGDAMRHFILSYDMKSNIEFSMDKFQQSKQQIYNWRKLYYDHIEIPVVAVSINQLNSSKFIQQINQFKNSGQWGKFRFLIDLMGFSMYRNLEEESLTTQWKEEKKQKNYQLADKIRDRLIELGVDL